MTSDVKEFATAEGGGWSYPLDVNAFDWSRVARFPAKRFLERPLRGHTKPWTKADWKSWLDQEIANADDPSYYKQLEREWLADPSAFGEVIIAELPDGTLDVGDGWHRLAMSIVRGRTTVPAIVGKATRKRTVEAPRAKAKRLDQEIDEFLTEEALHRRGLL